MVFYIIKIERDYKTKTTPFFLSSDQFDSNVCKYVRNKLSAIIKLPQFMDLISLKLIHFSNIIKLCSQSTCGNIIQKSQCERIHSVCLVACRQYHPVHTGDWFIQMSRYTKQKTEMCIQLNPICSRYQLLGCQNR